MCACYSYPTPLAHREKVTNYELQGVLPLHLSLIVVLALAFYHAVAAHYSQLGWRQSVRLRVEQNLPEEADHVHEYVVVDRRQLLEEPAAEENTQYEKL